jgi:5-(carboxyamino)imidazole ribonucleotide mutase
MLSVDHPQVAAALAEFRKRQTDDVASNDDPRR